MSLFKPSSETGKQIFDKILIYGPTHTSKTHAALGWPDPALVDVENRGAHFADRFTFFHARPRTQAEVLTVLDELKSGAIGCKSIIFDSYSADYEKLVVTHTTTAVVDGKVIATTDYASINRRIAPVREFMFATYDRNLLMIAHQQQKYDRQGKLFTKRQEPEFLGDAKFRYAFDYIFRTEGTGPDPRVHPVKFIVEKSASPNLKIGDVLLVKPTASLYELFRNRVLRSQTPAAQASAPSSPAAASAQPPMSRLRRIEELVNDLQLDELELGKIVRNITRHQTASVKDLKPDEQTRLIAILEQRVKGAA